MDKTEHICIQTGNPCGFPCIDTCQLYKDMMPPDPEDDDFDFEDGPDFECCDNCDMPDACEDFGCAIKTGVRKDDGSW